MATDAEDALSAAGQFFTGLWGRATDYLTARENRKEAEAMTSNRTAMDGGVTSAAGNWTNPDAVAAAMGSGNKYQSVMLVLAFAGVAISLLAFIRK